MSKLYKQKRKKMKKSLILLLFTLSLFSETQTIVTDIFTVEYSEFLEQPLRVEYTIECPNGNTKRSGLDFRKVEGINTSDVNDYKNNIWDRGHLAPAAAFSCDRETLAKTFSYLNCALQHEGLNRGPWKELERFERDLAKIFEVKVIVEIAFTPEPLRVPAGAAIPIGFSKTIMFDGKQYKFYFPNTDVAGQDWFNFSIAE